MIIVSLHCQADNKSKGYKSYLMDQAFEAYEDRDYAKAMKYLEQELDDNPRNTIASILKATIHKDFKEYGKAFDTLDKGLKYASKKDKDLIASIYNTKGSVYECIEDTAMAISCYKTADSFKHDDCKYLHNISNLLNGQGKYEEDQKIVLQILEREPNDAVSYVYAGRNAHFLNDYNKAIDYYNYAVKLDDRYSSSYSFRAQTFIAMKNYKEAAKDIVMSLGIDYDQKAWGELLEITDSAYFFIHSQLNSRRIAEPNNEYWLYCLGVIAEKTERFAEAEKMYKKALQLCGDPNNERLCSRIAEVLSDNGKYNEALMYINRAIDQDSDYVSYYKTRADIYYYLKEADKCIADQTKIVELRPESASSYAGRARRYMLTKRFDEALEDIDYAIALAPDWAYYYLQRASILQHLGRKSDANADLKLALDFSKKEDLSFTEAYAYAHLLMQHEADSCCQNKFVKNDSREDNYEAMCIYSILGQTDKALYHMERALQKGYYKFAHMECDFDLDNIRNTERYKELIEKYKAEWESTQNFTSQGLGNDEMTCTEIPFTREGGVCTVRCSINDLPLRFVFDTGASTVSISMVEATFMFKNDYITSKDIVGTQQFVDANGNVSEGTTINLRKVSFGGLELNNVRASVVRNQKAPLLLGQSVLNRLGIIEIDNEKSVLRVKRKR